MNADRFADVARELAGEGFEVRRDHRLAPLTTYAVGGACAVAVVMPDMTRATTLAAVLARHPDVPVALLGRGSNTLVSDEGFSGVVVVCKSAPPDADIDLDGPLVHASGAMLMPLLARRSVVHGRSGLEWCVGIPGSVGGAVRMNAGGHGAEMVDSLQTATVVSLRSGLERQVPVASLGLHFRGSALSDHHVVTAASFLTGSVDESTGQAIIDEVVSWRRKNQPGGRNAGSVFVNPAPGAGSAGALIDAAGLRGHGNAGARVSDKHANFIQAAPDGRASDIIEVMTEVQRRVEHAHGVVLRSEVRLLGFSSDVEARFADSSHESSERVEARARLQIVMGDVQ